MVINGIFIGIGKQLKLNSSDQTIIFEVTSIENNALQISTNIGVSYQSETLLLSGSVMDTYSNNKLIITL